MDSTIVTPGGPASGASATGNGGGGQALNRSSTFTGGSGGSGVVILSIPSGSYSGVYTGGPSVTTSGGNVILTFTGSGTYTV
jgi:hypothetical protein